MSGNLMVIEPRHEDGTLNVNLPMVPEGSNFSVGGVTEDQLFDFYFAHHSGKETANSGEMYAWYRSLGYSVRTKTW